MSNQMYFKLCFIYKDNFNSKHDKSFNICMLENQYENDKSINILEIMKTQLRKLDLKFPKA